MQEETLTSPQIANKSVTLTKTPSNPSVIFVSLYRGLSGMSGYDFKISGSVLSWDGYGFETELSVSDVIQISYQC